MSRQIIFYVEGYTELEFVNEIIGPHLGDLGIIWHPPILASNSVRKDRTARGGVRRYDPIRKDLRRLLAQYHGANFTFTTILDYYGLPGDFPLRNVPLPGVATPLDKVQAIEKAWRKDIDDNRFLPNLLLHEYETLYWPAPTPCLPRIPKPGRRLSTSNKTSPVFKTRKT